jgi:hypothetical protein
VQAQTKNCIRIHSPTSDVKARWGKVLELAEILGPEVRWSLIGGLMVQLHGFECGGVARPTADIDILGDSRRRPEVTERIAAAVVERGGKMAMPPMSDETLGFRFELDGETIEVLGPDGLGREPRTIGRHVTFQVPGGTQALLRTEVIPVSLDGGPSVAVRRPSLLGAILIKARVVAKVRDRKHDSDRQDLVRLLSLVDDPRAMADRGRLKKSEKRWLRSIGLLLEFGDAAWKGLFRPAEIARAVQAYRLLIR